MGKRFRFFRDEFTTEVVGIARDSKYNFLGEAPQPFIYTPSGAGRRRPVVTLTIRSTKPEASLGTVRAIVQQMEPNMPLVGVFTMSNIFDQALWAPRMGALLLAIFGGLALALAVNRRIRRDGVFGEPADPRAGHPPRARRDRAARSAAWCSARA